MDNSTPGMEEKLVQYLDAELTGAEKESLEQQLADSAILRDELDQLKATRAAIRQYGLKTKVAAIHREMMEELQPGVKKIKARNKLAWYGLRVAASVFLVVAGYLTYTFFSLSPEKVFDSGYQSYELVTVRDASTNETAVEKAYREKNYKEVMRIHDTGEDATIKGKFLCGAAALEVNENDKAIDYFEGVLKANKLAQAPAFNDESEYYLSLSYIRRKKYTEALDLLQKIQDDPEHLYKEKVSGKLVRQVKQLKRR